MKICFLLQRRFAYVGHAMALALQTRFGVTDFCGYVYLRSSLEFLQSQKQVRYATLLLDEDIHQRYKTTPLDRTFLERFEEEYGIPNLWPYIDIDRVTGHGQFVRDYPHEKMAYTHEEAMRILQVKAQAIIELLEKEKPDAVLFSVIGDIGSMLLYHVAKKKGIPIFFIATARIGNRYSATDDYRTLEYIEALYRRLQKKEVSLPKESAQARMFLSRFRESPTPHSPTDTAAARPITRKKQLAFLSPRNFLRSIHWALVLFARYAASKNRADYETAIQKPWHYLWDKCKRKARIIVGFDRYYDSVDLSEKFAFFPLHLEPEISFWLFAPFYKDQLWLIKQIARSLPFDFKLYVKEHPAMWGFRTQRFYRELKKIPNVKLIHPSESGLALIANARLLTTIAGTAGWEGMLLKKPVITFGDVFYNALPMAKKCIAIENLPHLIKEQLLHFSHDEQALLDMITAVYKESAELDLVQIWDKDGAANMERKEREVVLIVDYIARKLNLKRTGA